MLIVLTVSPTWPRVTWEESLKELSRWGWPLACLGGALWLLIDSRRPRRSEPLHGLSPDLWWVQRASEHEGERSSNICSLSSCLWVCVVLEVPALTSPQNKTHPSSLKLLWPEFIMTATASKGGSWWVQEFKVWLVLQGEDITPNTSYWRLFGFVLFCFVFQPDTLPLLYNLIPSITGGVGTSFLYSTFYRRGWGFERCSVHCPGFTGW